MKDPAFLFYSSDFLTGVIDLTMEERGQYITLLCLQHQKGHLSEKTIRLSVGSISVDVRNKFALDKEGNLYNEVLEKYIEERLKFTESRRNNGLKGGRPKKEEKPLGLPSANLSEDENENEIKDEIKRNKRFIAPVLDDVKNYFKENGYKEETAIKFFQSYSVANWFDSKGNKVKNWKQKAINVWFKDENKLNCDIEKPKYDFVR